MSCSRCKWYWRTLALATFALFLLAQTEVTAQNGSSRVDSLIEALTLDEKLTLLHGAQDPTEEAGVGYVPGIRRLEIPPIRLTDGPAGIRTDEPATALPAPIALGASFEPRVAHRYGTVIGREGRARGQDVLLSPMVNMIRLPQAGRNFETLGEDPLLSSRLVAEEIRGIQEEGMIATVKHYVANNFERDRMMVSAEVAERPLREIYLPAFRAAVDAGAGSVMCAYNRVNGTYACDNERLLTDVLREDFGFEGWVMTDWFAGHSLQAIHAGTDQEMPGFTFPGVPQPVYFHDSLRVAIEDGQIQESVVDTSVRRILGQMERMDLLGGSVPSRPELDEAAGAEVAQTVAEKGAVLLRNEGQALPLGLDDGSMLAVIGPTAQHPLYGGGGSSHVQPTRLETPVEALRRAVGSGVRVRYAEGVDLEGVAVPSTVLSTGEETDTVGMRRTGGPESGQIDRQIDFTGTEALTGTDRRTWSGTLTAPSSGTYGLKLQTAGGGGTLRMDGEDLVTTQGFFSDASLIPTSDGLDNATATVDLKAGERRHITLTVEGGGGVFFGPEGSDSLEVRLAWVPPSHRDSVRRAAAETAREADAAVVFAYNEGTEGEDRTSLGLPGAQNALVSSVAEADTPVSVVLNTGDPVLMPWRADVNAILQMWYPGQEGAAATARLLTGKRSPSGHLPVTFPRQPEDAPTHPEERYPGRDGRAQYSEGVFVGYRWYDKEGLEPLYPFGHGETYTTFRYSNLSVQRTEDTYEVRFRIENVGDREAAAVPQVYVGAPSDSPVSLPPKQLAGFERVELASGEASTVTVVLEPRALSYWSTESDAWQTPPGTRPVHVGASSRDLRLETSLELE